MLCAAPTVLIGIANAPEELRQQVRRAACACSRPARRPAAATIERIEGDLGWHITQVYGLTETAPFITICEQRPEDTQRVACGARGHQSATGCRADHVRRAARRR